MSSAVYDIESKYIANNNIEKITRNNTLLIDDSRDNVLQALSVNIRAIQLDKTDPDGLKLYI